MWIRIGAVFILTLTPVLAERTWEVGAAVGYGWTNGGGITAMTGSAYARTRNRYAAGIAIVEDLYDRLSGEFRYTYHDGDPVLEGRGEELHVRGSSHAFTYDFLIQIRDPEQRVRPFVAAGIGAKLYRVDWPPLLTQPLADIAELTTRDDWRAVFSLGGGVRIRLAERVMLRFDFRDFISQFPRDRFEPSERGASRGVFHQFTPLVGIGYMF